MKKAVSFLISVYASVPVLLYLFPWILVRFPFFVDLSRPEDVLNHTCNFYLSTEEGVSVGVWHTLPASQWDDALGRSPEWYRETLGDGRPIIIYLHGNVGTRWDESILSAAGYHVLSVDYRGFGDSTGEPSEAGLTSDALYLYDWVKKQSRGSLVCLWGHSLGSGSVSSKGTLTLHGSAVDALILEAPYTRIGEVVAIHPLIKVKPVTFNLCLQPLKSHNNISSLYIRWFLPDVHTLTSPLLILHSKDDSIVPHHMGQKVQHNTDVQVKMFSYDENLGFSHSNIYLDPNLPNVVREFLQNLTQ
uniref:Serine aminopeptidase S33 domain-containing protein n=1 Tax=Anabas testudineus TaxID=64144 RepID=A0A3Q1I9G7_ANATE